MNITDKLYTEWAWRTESGVPDINNPKDKAILDSLIKDLIPENKKVEEENNTEAFTKDDLINYLKNTELSDDQILRIRQSVTNIGYKDDIIGRLVSKGFTKDSFRSQGALDGIFQGLTNINLESLLNYLKKPSKLASPKGNIPNLTGLDLGTVNKIFSIEPGLDARGSAIGPGEIGLGLLFSDVDNRSGGGDLNWSGANLEVKKTGGRLGQQGGRTSTVNVLDYLSKTLISDEGREQLQDIDNIDNMPHSLKAIYDIARKEGKTEQEIFKSIANIVDQIYYNKDYTRRYFNSGKDFADMVLAKKNLIKINLHSYMDSKNIGAMLFWSPSSGNYLTFKKEDIDKIVDSRAIDTSSSASPRNASLGYRWNNPYPQLYFI